MLKVHAQAAALAMLMLAGCSNLKNPLGEPIWSNWGSGQTPVSAYDADRAASTPTGALPAPDNAYGASAEGRAPVAGAPIEAAPLPPPRELHDRAPRSEPRADFTPQSPAAEPTRVAQVSEPALVPQKPEQSPVSESAPMRTLPLIIVGQGIDRGTTGK